jgi:hypothetical protein
VTFPWTFGFTPQRGPATPRELLLRRLSEGVPLKLAARAAGIDAATLKDDPEVDKALAEGEIVLFERARDSGVTGAVRAAMRREAETWMTTAEPNSGASLEDLLRD